MPIVPTAILFDLLNGGDKDWDWPPYRELAYAAAGKAGADFALGNAGAGLGAKAGNLKGGLGSASAVDPASGLQVGALVAVNARGYTTMGDMPQFWAWALEQGRPSSAACRRRRTASLCRCRTRGPTSPTIRPMPRAAIRAPTPPSPSSRPTPGSTRRPPSAWR